MSVIPANINKEHIIKAIERFDKEGHSEKKHALNIFIYNMTYTFNI